MTHTELRELTEFHRQTVELANKARGGEDPSYRGWCVAKRVIWMCLLGGSFLFFHLISKMHEALTIL
jgi:hypothetical protein